MEDFSIKTLSPDDGLISIIDDVVNELKSDESFFVADLSNVTDKFNYWKFKLPRVHSFYAVKTNSEIPFLRFMLSLGAHFDCASKEEINWAMTAGALPSEIIYAHTFKLPSHLRYAKSKGVDLMTFDTEEELVKIKKNYPEARLVLRFGVPAVNSAFKLDGKFGCEFDDCYQLLKRAHQLGLNVVGACFHVGGLCKDPTAYSRAIKMARIVFDEAKDFSYEFNLLDIGGGFPGHFGSLNEFDKMCYYINQALEEYFPEGDNVRIIAEPGTYFSCSAFTLCTNIIGKRKAVENGDDRSKEKLMYYLNDGIYGSFFTTYEEYSVFSVPLLSEAERNSRPILRSKLWGPTCCSDDWVKKECFLPEMNVGEYLAFFNMGAYTLSITSSFNGFPQPPVRYVYSNLEKKGLLDKDETKENAGKLFTMK